MPMRTEGGQVAPLYIQKLTERDAANTQQLLDDMRQRDARLAAEMKQVTPQDTSGGFWSETGRALLGGTRDALQELVDTTEMIGKWFGSNGYAYEFKDVAPNTSAAGTIARGAVQFASGFVPFLGAAGKIGKGISLASKAAKGRTILTGAEFLGEATGAAGAAAKTSKMAHFAQGMAAGAATDFTVFDPHEARLANLWQEFGPFQSSIADFLAAKSDDSDAMGRLKNTIEGGAIGLAGEALFLGARALKARMDLRKAGKGSVVDAFDDALHSMSADIPKDVADIHTKATSKVQEAIRKAQGVVDGQVEGGMHPLDDLSSVQYDRTGKTSLSYDEQLVIMREQERAQARAAVAAQAEHDRLDALMSGEVRGNVVDMDTLRGAPQTLEDNFRPAPMVDLDTIPKREVPYVGHRGSLDIPEFQPGVFDRSIIPGAPEPKGTNRHIWFPGHEEGPFVHPDSIIQGSDYRPKRVFPNAPEGSVDDFIESVVNPSPAQKRAARDVRAEEVRLTQEKEYLKVLDDNLAKAEASKNSQAVLDAKTMDVLATDSPAVRRAKIHQQAMIKERQNFVEYMAERGASSADEWLSEAAKVPDKGLGNAGFAKVEAMAHGASGATGALVGGAKDLDGDGKFSMGDVALGFLAGVGLSAGTSFIVRRLNSGSTSLEQAFLDLKAQRKGDVESTRVALEEALKRPGIAQETADKLTQHIGTLKRMEAAIDAVTDVKELTKAIKEPFLQKKFAENLKPTVSITKASEGRLAELSQQITEASAKGDQGMVDALTKERDRVAKGGSVDDLVTALVNNDVQAISENLDIGFKHLETADDVKGMVAKTVDLFGTRKLETRPEAIVKAHADEMGLTVEQLTATLNKTYKDTQHMDSAVYASRALLVRSAEELKTLVQAAKDSMSSGSIPVAEILAVRKQAFVHAQIMKEVSGIGTELGRAVNAFKIVTEKANVGNIRAMDDLLTSLGGVEKNADFLDKLGKLLADGENAKANNFIRSTAGSPKLNALKEYLYNSLLSNPATWAVNITGNTLAALAMPTERLLAGTASLLTKGEAHQFREAQAMFVGMTEGIKDAWRLAARSFKEDRAIFDPYLKMDSMADKAISSAAFELAPDSVLGKALDVLGTGIRFPTRILTSSDEFFKAINSRMATQEMMYREARKAAELAGVKDEFLAKSVAERIQELRNNPPLEIMQKAEEYGRDMGRFNTWTNPVSDNMKPLAIFIERNPLARIVCPFLRVPLNIVHYITDRTPVINMLLEENRRVLMSGTRVEREALAGKMAMGGLMYATGAIMAAEGVITGGGNRKDNTDKTIAGWQPYSVKLGDKYYAYNRVDPFGAFLGLAADMTDILGKAQPHESSELVAAAVAAFTKNMISKTYLKSLADLTDVLYDPSPNKIQRYLYSQASTLFPQSAGNFAFAKAIDPVTRETHDLLDYFQKKVPGGSQYMFPTRNIFGEEVRLAPGYGLDSMSPFYTSKATDDPVKKELMRLGVSSKHQMSAMRKINGVELTPEQHDRYLQVFGPELKKSLDHLVGSAGYQQASDNLDEQTPGGKKYLIGATINNHIMGARAQLYREYPELFQKIQAKSMLRSEARKSAPNTDLIAQLQGKLQ